MSNPHDHHDKPAASHEAGPLPEARLVAAYTPKGHEIDYTPNKNLFGFLAVMSVLLVLTAAGVYQLFVDHTDGQLDAAASKKSAELEAHDQRDAEFNANWGVVHTEGKISGYRMPITEAKKLVLANQGRFVASPPPADWVHPDDAPKAAPAPTPAP